MLRQADDSPHEMGDTITSGDQRITVSDPTLHRDIVIRPGTGNHLSVARKPSAQWLVVSVDVEGSLTDAQNCLKTGY